MRLSIIAALLVSAAGPASGQGLGNSLPFEYSMQPNVSYLSSAGWAGTMDLYLRRDARIDQPTIIWIHGGNSTTAGSGAKENQIFTVLRYLERGWNVVNLEHRVPGQTLALESLRNVMCAVRWLRQNAAELQIDPDMIVISGSSSGGWFSVAAAMSPVLPSLESACPGSAEPRVAAVVNWYGNWDLADVLEGPNAKPYAPGWVAGYENPLSVAREISPLSFTRKPVPPVISIHGDADPTVPYAQSVRLTDALRASGVDAELVTVPGGAHGGFPKSEQLRAYHAIDQFLAKHGLQPK
jgi:acetyl esterase/lipase